MVWGAGFSGSMPLLAATPGNPMAAKIAALFPEALPDGTIPIQHTLLATYNIFLVVAMIVVLPLITARMLPKTPRGIAPSLLENDQSSFNIDVPKDAVPAGKQNGYLVGQLNRLGILGELLLHQRVQHQHQRDELHFCGCWDDFA